MEKVSVGWMCEGCHEENMTVAWRTRDTDDLEPVIVRAKCPICGTVVPRHFRPGTDPNTEETYTLAEWTKRGETERATRHSIEGLDDLPDVRFDSTGEITDAEMAVLESKAEQCQPPHLASTWELVPPINEWYARDVPRLVSELRRLRALVEELRKVKAAD
jgi:hypothetical protein